MKEKKSNFSETLLNVFQACGVSLPPLSPEKSMSITDPGGEKGEELSRGALARGMGTGSSPHEGVAAVLGANGARHLRPPSGTERDSKH